ncbi:MAG: cystathionine gamma-synthase [Bacteroidota bacterium]
MKFATKAIHAGVEADPTTGAIMPPIYQTSTYKQEGIGNHKGFEYARSKNPTRLALEACIASLENAKYGACFSSGMAAIDTLLKLCSPGDEVITSADLYGGTYRLFETLYAKRGIKFHYTSSIDSRSVEELIDQNTKLVWLETPSNPLLKIADIKAISEVLEDHKAILAVDNTFATPYLQKPLDLGADVVMHSATKYLCGHSDVIMGVLATNNKNLSEDIYYIQNSCGAISGPQDCFLAMRGIKTLHLRLQRHCENAAAIASFLVGHPAIEEVHYPGLESSEGHEIAKHQMKGFGGMISISLKNESIEAAHRVLDKTRIFTLAESLGGVESLIGHPASMSHASIPANMRDQMGISDSLIRISVGVEDLDDLLSDLEFALL